MQPLITIQVCAQNQGENSSSPEQSTMDRTTQAPRWPTLVIRKRVLPSHARTKERGLKKSFHIALVSLKNAFVSTVNNEAHTHTHTHTHNTHTHTTQHNQTVRRSTCVHQCMCVAQSHVCCLALVSCRNQSHDTHSSDTFAEHITHQGLSGGQIAGIAAVGSSAAVVLFFMGCCLYKRWEPLMFLLPRCFSIIWILLGWNIIFPSFSEGGCPATSLVHWNIEVSGVPHVRRHQMCNCFIVFFFFSPGAVALAG